jgi:hypothetical protein
MMTLDNLRLKKWFGYVVQSMFVCGSFQDPAAVVNSFVCNS